MRRLSAPFGLDADMYRGVEDMFYYILVGMERERVCMCELQD